MEVSLLYKNNLVEIERILFDLIEIESHQFTKGYEVNVTNYIYSYFEKHAIEVELQHVVNGRCNIIARVKGEGDGPTLLLNGHTDTVPPYDMIEPFSPKKINDNIYGRGSVDMKGAIATMMVVISTLQKKKSELNGTVIFAGTIGEESYSPGADFFSKSNEQVDYCIVGEPTNMEIGIAHKGVIWGQAEFEGVSVHGSMPKQGVNAIYKANKWINVILDEYIPEIEKRNHPILGPPSFNIGQINGGTRPVIVPSRCIVNFEQRLLPGEKEIDVLDELQEIMDILAEKDPEFKGKVTEMPVFKGVPHRALETNSSSKLVSTVQEVCRSIMQVEKKPIGLGYWTDGALLSNMGADVIVCGPGNIEQAHSDNEYISCSELELAYKVYLLSILKLCGKERREN